MKKENSTNKKCIGCGITLQYDNPLNDGYIPENKYNDSSYCQRCFKLIHYNKKVVSNLNITNDEIINKLDSHVFFLTDLFNISKEVIDTYKKIKTDKILMISKSDLIPKDFKLDKIKNNIKEIYDIKEDIIFFNSKNSVSFFENKLDKLGIMKCYIVGYTNAGKSTFINKLIDNKIITASNNPNTTLDFMEIKLGDKIIIDTPGFNLNKTFYQEDEFDLIKRLNPKYYIKPLIYQAKPEQYFNIENKLFINLTNYSSIVFYMSNLLKIKKMYKCGEDLEEIKINDNTDIVIPSLGFIKIKKSTTIKINKDMINLIEIRNSLFS